MAALKISYLNIRGQTGLQIGKQLQIEEFLKLNKSDILNLQEINLDSDTFSECSYIVSNYTLLSNNASNRYGTACLIRSDLYLPSGTDGRSRNQRENYCALIIPQILVAGEVMV